MTKFHDAKVVEKGLQNGRKIRHARIIKRWLPTHGAIGINVQLQLVVGSIKRVNLVAENDQKFRNHVPLGMSGG